MSVYAYQKTSDGKLELRYTVPTETELLNTLANYVDTTNAQTIGGVKSFNSLANFNLGLTANSTLTANDIIYAYKGINSATITPTNNNYWTLGTSSAQWKTIYLAGELTDGTNSVTVANIVTLDSDQTIEGKKLTTQRLVYKKTVAELPEGYETAIVTLSKVKIDSGIQVSSLTLPTIEASIHFISMGDLDFFGTINTSQPTIVFNIDTQTGTNYVRWGSTSYNTAFSYKIVKSSFNNIKIESTASNVHKFYLNNTLLGVETHTASFTNTENIFIGQGRFNTSDSSWENFKIWNEGILVFNGIAAYEESSNSYGFYDTVSKTFKTTSGATGLKTGEDNYALVSEIPTDISELTSDTQQAAINSGITLSLTKQITTNKNDILSLTTAVEKAQTAADMKDNKVGSDLTDITDLRENGSYIYIKLS